MFDPSIIWNALREEGMLTLATPAGGALPQFWVGFLQPDGLILGEAVQSAQIDIEYVTSEATLAVGSELVINGTTYRVRQPPRKKVDGYFSVAPLEEISP